MAFEDQSLMGDPIARGIVEECPECNEWTLERGVCTSCGYDDLEDEWPEEHWMEQW